MRTTLDLEEQVLDLARGRARRRKITLGQAVSELALAGARAEAERSRGSLDIGDLPIDPLTGIPYFPGVPGSGLSLEEIADIVDEMDEEDARVVRDS